MTLVYPIGKLLIILKSENMKFNIIYCNSIIRCLKMCENCVWNKKAAVVLPATLVYKTHTERTFSKYLLILLFSQGMVKKTQDKTSCQGYRMNGIILPWNHRLILFLGSFPLTICIMSNYGIWIFGKLLLFIYLSCVVLTMALLTI